MQTTTLILTSSLGCTDCSSNLQKTVTKEQIERLLSAYSKLVKECVDSPGAQLIAQPNLEHCKRKLQGFPVGPKSIKALAQEYLYSHYSRNKATQLKGTQIRNDRYSIASRMTG